MSKIKVRFYLLSFGYPGPYSNFGFEPADAKLEEAEKLVSDCLTRLGYETRNAYSWTDGSLYKYVKTQDGQRRIMRLVTEALPEGYKLHSVILQNPATDPRKYKIPTLHAYFQTA
jgi:hypothetical protein